MSPTARRLAAISPAVLALAAGLACAENSPPLIRLAYAAFDPVSGTPAIPESLRASAANELLLVQYASAPTDANRADLTAAGATVERFLTDHTYIIRAAPARSAVISSLPGVRWVGPYHPAYRLSSGTQIDALSSGPAVRHSIECMRPDQPPGLAAFIIRIGGSIDLVATPSRRMEATLTPTQLRAVAACNEVSFIDEWGGPGGVDMDIARQLGNAVPLLSNLGISGQGVRGHVIDTEIDVNHPAFQNPPPLIHGPYVPSTSYHGSATYGICFANWAANPQLTGMLPNREQGIFAQYTQLGSFGGPNPLLTFLQQATDPLGPYRSVFVTSSVGNAQVSQYNTISAETDDALFRTDVLMTQSISNTGNTTGRPQAWAKNIVAVGGITHQDTLTRADDTAGNSSFGPAADGRVKPDLAHIHDSVQTTWAPPPQTIQFNGTSASTPITAGYFGLIFQLWHQEAFRGFGGGPSVFADRPHAATARALAFNTAYRYNWLSEGPNATILRRVQGWGMIDIGNLYAVHDKLLIVNQTESLTQGQTRAYQVQVGPEEPMLAATLVYIDPPGTPAAQHARINDLSLKLTSPSGTVYWGNNGLWNGNISTSGGVANTIDPVENVFLSNPAAGMWTVEVIATEIVMDAHLQDPAINADFALVVSGITPAASCYANCDGSTLPPVLNVADYTCFLNKFAAGSLIANCDGSTTSPALNVADFICYMNSYAAGCP